MPFFADLKSLLAAEIKHIIINSDVLQCPIGRWLEDDLIYLTYQQLQQNARQASLRIGVSLSTLRRKIDKYHEMLGTGSKLRTRNWQQIEAHLLKISTGKVNLGPDCINTIKLLLLEAILMESPNNMTLAAALLGVSEPTMYKLKKQLPVTVSEMV